MNTPTKASIEELDEWFRKVWNMDTGAEGEVMTEEKRLKIEALALEHLHKRQAVEGMSILNTYGQSQDTLERMAKDYALAQALVFEAEAALLAAQKP